VQPGSSFPQRAPPNNNNSGSSLRAVSALRRQLQAPGGRRRREAARAAHAAGVPAPHPAFLAGDATLGGARLTGTPLPPPPPAVPARPSALGPRLALVRRCPSAR
jgi:hypothetical protein